jgi:2-polyprenyl-3-methyl-5-hydroxy-6-metoxy-1,4-benzoquinol methylase
MAPTYDPTVFHVASEPEAKAIILTPEAGMSTEERWVRETTDVVKRISSSLASIPEPRLLDWGCGIGRLARPLCHDHGFKVTGVDLSADMRRLAVGYVNHPAFEVMSPATFTDGLAKFAQAYDAALAAWVLQHIPKIEQVCRTLARALKPGGHLFLLNRVERLIPVVGGWISDGKDVAAALRASGFTLEVEESLGLPLYAEGSIWSIWRAA